MAVQQTDIDTTRHSCGLRTPDVAADAHAPGSADFGMPVDAGVLNELPIDAIEWRGLVRRANREHIARLGGVTSLPAIVVWEYAPGRFRGIDGFHRWLLAKVGAKESVAVSIRRYAVGPRGERESELDAVRLNISHGLPFTREERDRAIRGLWKRWGRTELRPDGMTLEQLSAVFNLTKQRVHQILTADHSEIESSLAPSPVGAARPGAALARSSAGGRRSRVRAAFSSVGRFNAAVKRMAGVLKDRALLQEISLQHPEVLQDSLAELMQLIDPLRRRAVFGRSGTVATESRVQPAKSISGLV